MNKMTIQHLKWAKELQKEGQRLGRSGMSQLVLKCIEEFDGSYKGAMILAGRLKSISQAAKSDEYWSEKVNKGFIRELSDIKRFEPSEE